MADDRPMGNRNEGVKMIQQFRYNDDLIEAHFNSGPSGTEIAVGDNQYRIEEISPGKFAVLHNGIKKFAGCVVRGNKAYVDISGLLIELIIPTEDGSTSSGAAGHAGEKDKIYAPMPGKIVKLLVKEGDRVEQKQPMVIVEAMKMENQVNSPSAGVVRKINFKDGDQVGTETPIIELEIET
jgi:acetyl/propionyl-CoA carboxylase alpha subunit